MCLDFCAWRLGKTTQFVAKLTAVLEQHSEYDILPSFAKISYFSMFQFPSYIQIFGATTLKTV